MLIRRHQPWHVPESALTPEDAWWNRRAFLRSLGLGSVALAAGCGSKADPETIAAGPIPAGYAYTLPPIQRNPRYLLDRPLTDEKIAATHNNFYELTPKKSAVWEVAGSLQPKPWQVLVRGLVEKERTFDIDALLKTMPIEERAYRFRCVEAWSMAVPWVGFPVKALLDAVKPLSSAKYVRIVTRDAPEMFPGVRSQGWYPWPYHEALTIEEATNELAIFAVGIYGHPLPNQHGAPIRLVTPWKYGYKQTKSIAVIELVDSQPPTFWNEVAPLEYDFWGNVRPDISHPRWSQATEQVIPTGERVPTLMYNGYADLVAGMYPF